LEIPGIGDRAGRALLSRQAGGGGSAARGELFTQVQKVLRESGYEEMLASGIA